MDHHAGQVGEHERLEGGQRPVAQEVIGQQVRAGDQQVALARLRPRAGADGSLIGADHRRGDDQRPDQLVRVLDRGSGAGQQAVHEPRRGLRPGQRLDQLRAPVHRDDVRGHQVHAPGLQADPVGHGARRPGSGGRGGPVHPPARAGHRVQVMLDDRRGHLRDLHLLVRGSHPQVHRAGQVRAAHARPPREMRHRPVGILAPGQVRARRARLLTRIPLAPPPRCGFPAGGVRPGWSSSDGGSEELPEFRDAARSSLASRSSSSPTRPASAAFCTASMAMSWPCSAISASRAASSGLAVTDHHHPGRPTVIKPARWAGHQKSSQAAATRIRLSVFSGEGY